MLRINVFFTLIPLLLLSGCGNGKKSETQSEFDSVSRVASGKPVGVVMTTYTTTMFADGKDKTLIRAFVVDSAGREIVSAELPIQISITGDAKIARTENGTSVTLLKSENGTSTWESKLV